ncbi:MAG: hypothetical protein IPM63_02250 [Acidobacteriota bacterium]|nr:MAG: hypothetical protein IPM63_02250 [Acidobacteriota bacterium]
MDIFQASIIYLACGIPFGVHYLLANQSAPRRYLNAAAISLFWIAHFPPLLHRLVTRKLNDSPEAGTDRSVPVVSAEVRECSRAIESAAERNGIGIYEVRNAVERFAGITALCDAHRDPDPPRFAAISQIAGHPDPELAAKVIARHNRAAVERHRRQATRELLEIRNLLSPPDSPDREADLAFIQLFELCGNSWAVKQIDTNAERRSNNDEPATRPRALRPLWRSTRKQRANRQLPVTLSEIAVTSILRHDD